jgi:flagellum-specific peptidoglycan hydrolase FlgJ
MHSVRRPTWQQATALVSLSTCGAMTGLSFTHGTVADMTSPTSMPVHLLAFKNPARTSTAALPASDAAPASESASESTGDSTLRSAIVNVANYYLRMAQSKTPAEMEALIWQSDSVDGVDHGESCAAFASLTLELGAQAAGQESWVTGGTSYPWPLHSWADVRVDPNPASPNVISVVQDAENNHRWHSLGDGYQPQPGDWVLFDGHVEVVTKYANGVLYTIGGDSLPNFSVNAHQYSGSLAADGVVGFVNNGDLVSAGSTNSQPASAGSQLAGGMANVPGSEATPAQGVATQGQAAVPGTLMAAAASSNSQPTTTTLSTAGSQGTAAIPGVQAVQDGAPSGSSTSSPSTTYRRSNPPPSTQVPGTAVQQAFISEVAPGAVAAQRRYGIPAAVTIAQAIEESGWGQSTLAVRDHNLFGIKGTGPAGADVQPTQEYENGRWVTLTAAFKVYHNIAESIADHSLLLATGPSYQQAMADRQVPDAFAADLTGVYATDPDYGSNLIALMQLYNLYRYDAAAQATSAAPATAAAPQAASQVGSAIPDVAPSEGGTVSQGSSASAEASGGSTGTARNSAGTSGGSAASSASSAGTSGRSAASSAGRAGTGARSAGTGARSAGTSAGTSTGSAGTAAQGGATIPGVLDAYFAGPGKTTLSGAGPAREGTQPVRRPTARIAPRPARVSPRRYVSQMPRTVTTDFLTTAKAPLTRAEPLYRDVAARTGIRWELLAACDWMQCKAQPRYSPVHGEKLGAANSDGTVYLTKSEALTQCANELVELAMAVYWIDITARRALSVRNLASVFAAFRWGGLLKLHDISAMEFPYSVEGLTAQHVKMRWPNIRERNAPDKPGARFHPPFGAVPVVLSLDYPAVDELSAASR